MRSRYGTIPIRRRFAGADRSLRLGEELALGRQANRCGAIGGADASLEKPGSDDHPSGKGHDANHDVPNHIDQPTRGTGSVWGASRREEHPMAEAVVPTGVHVGHWSDANAQTGVTVVVLPPGTVASGEIRGGAPASREFSLLDPIRTVHHVDAVCLSGGSAFGLAAADGVLSGLEADGRGFPTPAGKVPIVVGMSIFDLAVGDASVRPGPVQGRAAYDSASSDFATGRVGAGTGATLGKWKGAHATRHGGFGVATVRSGEAMVTALVVVNALGEIDDGNARQLVARNDHGAWPGTGRFALGQNTTIGVIVTNATLDKVGCHLLAQSAHDGLAHAVFPPHTGADGDGFVAAATGEVHAELEALRAATVVAADSAIRSASS